MFWSPKRHYTLEIVCSIQCCCALRCAALSNAYLEEGKGKGMELGQKGSVKLWSSSHRRQQQQSEPQGVVDTDTLFALPVGV